MTDHHPKSGLREKKRDLVRAAIESAAASLFDQSGIDGVRIGEIAERAVVSEGTLYNHFANKAALAERWARRRVHAAAEGAIGDSLDAPGSPIGSRQQARVLARAVARETADSRAALEPVWGRTGRTAAAADPPSAPIGLVQLFRRAQQEGEVRSDVEAGELADLVWAVIEQRVRQWLSRPKAGAEELLGSLRRAVDVVMDGSQKRHERVRAAATTRALPSI